jgi:hypothetical protein
MKHLLTFIAVFCIFTVPARAESKPDIYSTAFWLIPGPPEKITWVEIMNREEARTTGIAHVWVLARRKGAPSWEIEHVSCHIAITTEALQRSVIQPYKTRGAYPDSYFEALGRWHNEEKKGTAIICTTSIADCLKQQQIQAR